jgi:hypothetical protein
MSRGERLVSNIRIGSKLSKLDEEAEAAALDKPVKVDERVEEPQCLSGPLLKLSGTIFFTERWQLRWFEVRAGDLRWWDSPAGARSGAEPKGTQQLTLGARTQPRTENSKTQFTLEAEAGKNKVYVFDTEATEHALRAHNSRTGWDMSRVVQTSDMQAWMKIINQQKASSPHPRLRVPGARTSVFALGVALV